MSLDLHNLARRVMNAETPADGEQILREAIEQLIGRDEYLESGYGKGLPNSRQFTRNQLRHELLASIKPKENTFTALESRSYNLSELGFNPITVDMRIKPKGDK